MSASSPRADHPAPNIALQDERDEPVALSDLWAGAERGIVLSVLRQYG